MITLTEHYKEKYYEEIYDFCLPFFKKSTEAIMCALYAFMQLEKVENNDSTLLLNENNVKCFLLHIAKERCIRRVMYLRLKRENTALYRAKAFFKRIKQSIAKYYV